MSDGDLATEVAAFLTRNNSIAYAHIAPDLTVQAASGNFADRLGLQDVEIVGAPLDEVLWEFVGSAETLHAVLNGELPTYRLEHVQRETNDGAVGYLTFHVVPLLPQEPDRGLLLFIEDRTEAGTLEQHLVQERNELRLARSALAQANEELRRLNRLKSLFLSMAAHDLRTPLTVILGFAQLLNAHLPAELDQEDREYLETISAQAEWLDRLIGNLLALDQIEEGRLLLKPVTCDVAELAEEVREAMRGMTLVKNQELALAAPPSPTFAYADPERAKQILYNLVGNAVKYSPPGTRIEIGVDAAGSEGEVILTVRDEGRGMSEAELGRLFHPYYRTEEAHSSKVKGTGLGLFIVKTLAEAQNGRVAVSSALGQGSTFSVYLPAAAEASA